MSLEHVLAISEKPGLYKLITQTRSGLVAESLIDGKRIAVNLKNNVSLLSEIAIYTLTEEVPLKEVFKKIKEKEKSEPTSVGHKESKDNLEAYFFDILPEYDEDRVYVSDIKKVIRWYNILQSKQMLNLLEEAKSDEEE
ncbi:MAG: DUF5606 domain-containing protein [Bacteroidia bacterium]|nr:DUF5606 domain-containing protein [Bacteroidia bacterium]NND51128.1 DUF5606 domain-containing protein [Flavobacteriaceae bacterium]